MKTVTVTKAELEKVVKKNREGHQKIFDEAVEGYRKEAVKILEDHIKNIKSGKMVRVSVSLPTPENHTDDYDRVLKMLDMSVDDEITLDEEDFASYVMDDWHWKRAFITSASMYSATARRASDKL